MNCIFCKIAQQEIPASVFYEDDQAIAFLDIHPVKPGHALVIPKKHASYLFELEDDDYLHLMQSVKTVADKLKKAFQPKTGKVGAIVYGLDVDHVHIHLIPIDQSGDLSLGKAHLATDQELKLALEKIKELF